MPGKYENLFEDGAKLKISDFSVVCLFCNHLGPFLCCVILLWLFGDPDVIILLVHQQLDRVLVNLLS